MNKLAPIWVYGPWGGNPEGTPEDPRLCFAECYDDFTRRFYQCLFKRGKGPGGLFCGIHAYHIAEGRNVMRPTRKRSAAKEGR